MLVTDRILQDISHLWRPQKKMCGLALVALREGVGEEITHVVRNIKWVETNLNTLSWDPRWVSKCSSRSSCLRGHQLDGARPVPLLVSYVSTRSVIKNVQLKCIVVNFGNGYVRR